MSIMASIDFKLSKEGLTPVDIILGLMRHGWKMYDYGYKMYLPINDDDMFDWQRTKISDNEILEILKKKEELGELLGVFLSWQDTNIGGDFLIYQDCFVSIILNCGRQTNKDNSTNFDWYLPKLIPIFEAENIVIKSVYCEDM